MADALSPYGGVPSGQEGLILQRGGQELLLRKRNDRFLVRLADSAGSVQTAMQSLPGSQSWTIQAIEGTPLWAIHLPAHSPQATDSASDVDALMAQLRQEPTVQYVAHIYEWADHPETEIYIGDEVTIAFEPTVPRNRIQTLTTPLGLVLSEPVRGLDNTWITQLTPLARDNPLKIANSLMTLPEVLLAEANVILQKASFYTPKDDLFPRQWYLSKTQVPAAKVDIEADKAWDMTRGERSIVIAIADDGIDLQHPDFQGFGKIVAPRDLRQQDDLPEPDSTTDNHGTAVAGVAVAEENGSGIVGVAPGCALMPIRTTGYLDDGTVEQIFHWAVDHGAAVISCSWGAGSVHFPLSLRQQAALSYAAQEGRGGKGSAVIFAAGNFNRPVNATVQERGWPHEVMSGATYWLNGFAAHPDTIAVAACTSLGQKAAYSNWGNEIFIAAPSSNGVPAIALEKTGMIPTAPAIESNLEGLGVLSSDRVGAAGYDPGDFTDSFGGTSSAAPVVAGVVGLMLSINPNLTLAEVKDILRQTAEKVVDPNPDPQLGLRLGSYERNGHSPWFGYGKINAYQAVQEALNRKPPLPLASEQSKSVQVSFDPPQPLTIPDHDRLNQTLMVRDSGLLLAIEVGVEIEHEFLGDLEITLTSPGGECVLLQGRTLGRQTRLETIYSVQTTPGLERLLQTPSQGNWQISLNDRAVGCVGVLKHWHLNLILAG